MDAQSKLSIELASQLKSTLNDSLQIACKVRIILLLPMFLLKLAIKEFMMTQFKNSAIIFRLNLSKKVKTSLQTISSLTSKDRSFRHTYR